MTPERRRQIVRIWEAALARDPTMRGAFLAEACAGDEALRREVESLLTHEHTAEHLLETPGLSAAAARLAVIASHPVGRHIGAYEVRSLLGSGGMGEVYRARDTKLNRDVALKVLPELFALDRDRLARFKREAHVLASLNHPNIAAIYGFEESDGVQALVLELVEGETLADRLARGPIPLDEALPMATQVAGALESAHERGIIHRDLKPSNIKLRPDGTIKVLDFGLAKVLGGPPSGRDATQASTTTPPAATRTGAIMGTAAYMSPEQVRGQPVDTRTDIWAFGCLLYELLVGRQAFSGGESLADIFVRVLEREPDWRALPVGTPPQVRTLLERCLHKDARRRLRDIGDASIEIEDARSDTAKLASRRQSPVGRRGTAIHSVAILPLTNAGPDPNTEYLSDGITESIINSLSRLPELRVMAPSTVIHYKDRGVDPQTIGRQLGVRAVLAGKVLQIGERLIIRTELVDVADGTQLWGEQYNRPLRDIFEMQAEISQEIVQRLRLHLTSEQRSRLTKRHTGNVVAYEHYLRGRHYWNKRTATGFHKAIEYFEQAIATDPGYAFAYVGIADCYAMMPFYDQGSPMQFYHRAKTAAARALEIDSSLSEAHCALGHIQLYYDWDWPAAERTLKRAIELAPSSSEAHHVYAYYLSAVGRSTDAIQEFTRSLACDPVSLPVNAGLGVMFYFARQSDQAIQQLLKTIDLDANFAPAHAFLCWAYAQHVMYEQAVAECEKAMTLADDPWIHASLGYVHALAGNRGAAERVLDQLQERAKRGYVSPYDLAMMYAVLGHHDQALAYLEVAYQERSGVLIWGLQNDPRLDSLRTEAAFAQLLRRVGFAPEPDHTAPAGGVK